jgi:DnaJ family protein C protein 14
MKVEQAYPIVLKWLMHIGSIMLLISMVWLDCTLRGIDSFLRMGTTSFFSVIWFGIFSVIAMVGMLKFLIVLVSPVYVCDNSKILVLHLLIVVLIGLSS